MLTQFPPRDLIGYGKDRPHPHWPGDAKIAVNFVIVCACSISAEEESELTISHYATIPLQNYEEGGENTILNGDAGGEVNLQEIGPVRERLS